MARRRLHVWLGFAVVAVVTMVGAGACAFEPQGGRPGADRLSPVSATDAASGASASPGPSHSPSAAPPPAPPEPASPSPSKTAPPSCPQGDRQREVETYLARLGGFGTITIDGKQSAADCAAIKKFQRRYGISPVEGKAGPTTAGVAARLAGTDTRACQSGSGTTICVNLTLQTLWVMRDGVVVMRPTVTRTGMKGFATPAGTFTINRRNIREWSVPYKVWLPYFQHFYDGMGFHETTSYLHNASIGSHGCVNLLHTDAERLWQLGSVGTRVYLFGHRAGT